MPKLYHAKRRPCPLGNLKSRTGGAQGCHRRVWRTREEHDVEPSCDREGVPLPPLSA